MNDENEAGVQMTRSEIQNYIEEIIKSFLPNSEECPSKLAEAMNYAMTAGGKRIRPMLMFLAFDAFLEGLDEEERNSKRKLVEPFMAALEMIHTHSLIHDDLPALDNDNVRRGRPTVHVQFDESTAILAGDALLNYAYEIVLGSFSNILSEYRRSSFRDILNDKGFSKLEQTELSGAFDEILYFLTSEDIYIENEEYLLLAGNEINFRQRFQSALDILAQKTGINGMLGGQGLDVQLSGEAMSDADRDYIYKNKTSRLIEAPIMIGACLAGADKETVSQLEKAGESIGLAFQVQDDILDVIGDEKKLGKEIHQDERNEKNTYVASYGMEKSKLFVREESEKAVSIISEYLPESESRDIMISLVNELINREY